MNIKVVLEYDGSEFSGWQSQRDRRTVEAELQRALLLVTGTSPVITAAGRTDAGAHARGQVVNFRLERIQEPRRLLAALNAVLPQDIAAVSAEAVGDDFHARYSARLRRYRYRFLDRWPRPAIDRGYCWHVRRRLDVAAMDAAAAALTGEHDWTSFCVSAEPPSGRVRVMEAARVSRAGDFVELEL
ncbi:MAG TPA: tRNA pseudouridine(38-40) synthase TruA, partial [Candidatus Dormibacteraeota bacterium]|nr:tRNA pseudouridine(38-40) synthase TruA [Candidatus Dormibacteraeota bacterium]